jgi:hypothetical protein
MIRLFFPPRRNGLLLQSAASLFLMAGGALALLKASQIEAGPELLVYLLLASLVLIPLPLLGYRIYALWRAHYGLERDGLRLSWGLRAEDIPLTDIEWVRPAGDLVGRLSLPWSSWPGAVLGVRRVRGLGVVEFFAVDRSHLVLVGTYRKIFAISPSDPDEFIRIFKSVTELGSLSPIPAQSAYPTLLVGGAWSDPAARIFIISGLVLELALLAWVTLAIPSRANISLGFTPSGQPALPGPAARLMLLPVLNTINLMVDLLAGLFFFRKVELKPLAYLMWAGAIISPLLLLAAVYTILQK